MSRRGARRAAAIPSWRIARRAATSASTPSSARRRRVAGTTPPATLQPSATSPTPVSHSTAGPCVFWEKNLRQVVHTCASVTKQCNLVPIRGQRCSTAGKVTAGLESHWPRVADFIGLWAEGLGEEDDLLFKGAWHTLPLAYSQSPG